eukprot:Hpha_TRINITY_DN33465_c0_g1::TRINITY_DN33465_c0_g1_i1::g.848::m.848
MFGALGGALGLLSFGALSRPHIIHVVADDLGWNDVSLHGSSQIPTPTIDRLAREGVTLDQFYVNPVCSPTRSALVSGRQTIHTSIYNPLAHHENDGLNGTCNRPDSGEPCRLLPQVLGSLGYRTAMVGKWHVGMYNWSWVPQSRGFDFFTGYYTGAEDYYTHVSTDGAYDMQFNNAVDWDARGKYSTELFTERAIGVIEEHAANHSDTPLYLYLAYQAMHSPLQAPQRWIDRFSHINDTSRRTVAAMVACLDDGVRNVTAALSASGMDASNTLLIFHTDNGGPANGENDNMASNMPLRGRKASVHEGGVRGVAFMQGFGLKKTGYINRRLAHVSDWYFSLPTLALRGLDGAADPKEEAALRAYLGEQPAFLPGDGIDVWDALASDEVSPRTELIHVAQPGSKADGALRVGDWKLLTGGFQTGSTEWYLTPGQSFGENNFTVVCGGPPKNPCSPSAGACLFNIANDPCEHNDLSASEPDRLKDMLQKLLGYQSHAIKLKWHTEESSCLPENLPAPNTGADVPCVGEPPKLPPAPIPGPNATN